jgi:hypothetical protein
LWYGHRGEARKIRVDTCIDLLGGGLVLAPPSRLGQGYSFLTGGLEDVSRLPALANAAVPGTPTSSRRIEHGHRNNTLFEHLMREVKHVDDQAALMDVARTFSDERFAEPLADAELIRTVSSVWGYEARGKNRFGESPTVNLSRDIVLHHATRNPDAFALYALLQAQHKGLREEFSITKGMAKAIGWTAPRLKGARDYLIEARLITRTHPGGRGPRDPANYRF